MEHISLVILIKFVMIISGKLKIIHISFKTPSKKKIAVFIESKVNQYMWKRHFKLGSIERIWVSQEIISQKILKKNIREVVKL